MAKSPYILMPADNDAWRLHLGDTAGAWADIPAPPGAAPDAVATAAAQLLRAARQPLRRGILALPSSWCLCGEISVQGLPAKGRRQAMAYRLEEVLPLSAEQVASDFIASTDAALGIAVERERIEPWLAAFSAHQMELWPVAPAALLAAQALALPAGAALQLLWGRGEAIETIRLRADGLPAAWYTLPQQPQDVRNWLAAARADSGVPVVAIGLAADSLAALRETRLEVDERSGPAFDEGVASAAALKNSPWISIDPALAGDGAQLAPWLRRPLAAAAIGAAALLLSVTAAGLLRAARYDAEARRDEARQTQLFAELFPRSAPPPDVRSRLASEARRVQTPANAKSASAPLPAHAALRDLIDALPEDAPMHVVEIQIEADKFSIEGQTRAPADAEAISAALGDAGGQFIVQPPRTQRLTDKSISFTVDGTIQAPGAMPQPKDDK